MQYSKTCLFIIFLRLCTGYRILAFFPSPATSHYILGLKLVDGLARKGHQVTFITSYPREKLPENVTEIGINALQQWIVDLRSTLSNFQKPTFYQNYHHVVSIMYTAVENVIQDVQVQRVLDNGNNFDVAIVAECTTPSYVAIGNHFQVPVILFSTMPMFPWMSFGLKNPELPSWVSNIYSKRLQLEFFWERAINALYYIYSILYYNYMVLPKHSHIVKKHLPGGPDLYKDLNNVSLVLTNSHASSYEASIQVPNTIEIGGFHIDPPEPIPDDIKTFLDNSTNGVILFAMGSHCQISKLPKPTLAAIWKTFAAIKQNVLMKWEIDELPPKPPNVKLLKWIPQKDVLGHPNIKVFITHGGLLSTLESIYFGVPLIGIPITFDQSTNMDFAEFYGYGRMLSVSKITEKSFSAVLAEVLFTDSYKRNCQLRSKLMKDRPIAAMDAANYWVEQVVRHKGAPYLRYRGVEQSWHQRHLLDITVFTLVCAILLLKIKIKRLWCSEVMDPN